MRTALQNFTRRRREQARRRAWLDHDARTVGMLDYKLHNARCPYQAGTVEFDEWHAGYREAKG